MFDENLLIPGELGNFGCISYSKYVSSEHLWNIGGGGKKMWLPFFLAQFFPGVTGKSP